MRRHDGFLAIALIALLFAGIIPALRLGGDRADAMRLQVENAGWQEVGAGSATGGGISKTNGDSRLPSLALFSDGKPVVAWTDNTAGDFEVYVRRWNGSAWVEMGGSSASGGGISDNSDASNAPSIQVGPAGYPIVAWNDLSGPSENADIYVRRWNGSTWAELGSGSATGGGISNNAGSSWGSSLDVGPDGAPVVAWTDNTGGNEEIYVRRWNGVSWTEMGAGSAVSGGISQSGGVSRTPSVAVAGADRVVVAWQDDSSGDNEIYVRAWNGSSWTEVGTGSASGGGISDNGGASQSPSVALGPGQTITVAWTDLSSGAEEIYVRRWDGSAWLPVGESSAMDGGISDSSGKAFGPSLALNPEGLPIVAWVDDRSGTAQIYVRRWNGSFWLEMGDGSSSGGGISNNPSGASRPSLGVTPSGVGIVTWSSGLKEIYVRSQAELTCYTVATGSIPTAGGSVSVTPGPNCAGGKYTPGTQLTLTASPQGGYRFKMWSGDVSGTQNPRTMIVDQDKTATANFELACFDLNLSHTGLGANPIPAPSQSAGCDAGDFIPGEVIELSATAATGWTIAHWNGTNNDDSNAPTNWLTMPDSEHSVIVDYEALPEACYALTLGHTGQGQDPVATPAKSAGCEPGRYRQDQIVILSVVPAPDWTVDHWTGTVNDNSHDVTNLVVMPGNDHAAAVQFVKEDPVPGRVYMPHLIRMAEAGPRCYPGPDEIEPNTPPYQGQATGPLCSGQTYYGRPNDTNDFFYLFAQAGAIDIEVKNHRGGNTVLMLYYGTLDSKAIAVDNDASDGLKIVRASEPAGTYYIRLYSSEPKPDDPQKYSLTARFQ